MIDTFRRAQAEAVVAKRRSATMEFSDPDEQLEYEITLAEAALAEHAKAAPTSDVGALAERLRANLDKVTPGPWFKRERRVDNEIVDAFVCAADVNGFAYKAEILGDDEYREKSGGIARKIADVDHIADCNPDNIRAILDALLSAQEEAAGLRELVSDMSDSVTEVDEDRKFWKDRATRSESKLADAVGVLEKAKAYHDADHGMNGFTADYEILRSEIDEALTSIKETGDAR